MIKAILENSPLYVPLLQMKEYRVTFWRILLLLSMPEWVLNQFLDASLEVSPNSDIHKYATNQNIIQVDDYSPLFFIAEKENARILSSGEAFSKYRKLSYLNL